MRPSNCCTICQPPSPEGYSPRPLSTVSQSAANGPEPQPMASSWSTRFSKPEDAAELQAIFDNVSDDEGNDRGTTTSKHSSIANIVRKKLRKHFSRESTSSSHRPGRSSVGNSVEEVERRKELKRLRDRRIREELSVDDHYDDDAASLSVAAPLNVDLPIPDITQSASSKIAYSGYP
jgi:hypothetical protein